MELRRGGPEFSDALGGTGGTAERGDDDAGPKGMISIDTVSFGATFAGSAATRSSSGVGISREFPNGPVIDSAGEDDTLSSKVSSALSADSFRSMVKSGTFSSGGLLLNEGVSVAGWNEDAAGTAGDSVDAGKSGMEVLWSSNV